MLVAKFSGDPWRGLSAFYYWEKWNFGIFARGESRPSATSKMEHFVIIVNGFQPLTITWKPSILDVATAQDPPLFARIFTIIRRRVSIDFFVFLVFCGLPKYVVVGLDFLFWQHNTTDSTIPANINVLKLNNKNTRKKMWNMFKVNNKITRTMSLTSFWSFYC